MKRVTIEDVAKVAGVSRQTVSRAINDKSEISPATRDKVLAAVDQLGYRPNRLAQGMVTQRTNTIGLVVPDITNPFFPEVARGVQDVARDFDYNMFLCNSDESADLEREMLASLASQPVDGIIVFAEYMTDAELRAFAERYHPFVLINRHVTHPHISSVSVDIMAAARIAVDHLVELGYTKIGMVGRETGGRHSSRREQGFQAGLWANQLHDGYIERAPATLDGGYEAARALLAHSPEVEAIFAYSDIMALGAVRACRDLGRQVPDQCAILGFDDIRLTRISTPSLTTIRIDKYELGRLATCRLLEMLDQPQKQFQPIDVAAELIVRESTRL